MNSLLHAAAVVRARLAADWAWLQQQFDRFDAAAPNAAARYRSLEQRREGMTEQLDLVEAAEETAKQPDVSKPFAVLLGVLDFADNRPVTEAQQAQARRLARWQQQANTLPFTPGAEPPTPKQLRNPKAA